MNTAEIIPIEYGKSVLPESMIFRNGAEDKVRPIVFMVFLIKTEDRLILADAGCETMPGFVMTDFIGPIKALKDKGISTSDITDVIITHAHHDHIECVKYFKNSVIHIQEDEYEIGKEYFAENMNVKTFSEEVKICGAVKVLKIGGHSAGSCVIEITDGNGISVIAGDECYMYACLKEKIPTGCSYCPEKSEEFIAVYSDKKYNVLLCHEKPHKK